ncbi:hypothetical protein [Pseudonocardia sp.]|uniref:hypothetical protein n=1 Tax=Pseudonocardia sp. TaxID=60912 RepID=UPI002618C973|nr:hypothetical protein [Pseudonocardia sp.]
MPPRFELRAGAEITFGGAPDGRIIDVDPPELFAFSWGTDHLRREIRPDGAGSVLVLHHAFDDHHGAASFASGWSACVEGLGRLLAGETVAPTTDMTARHEEYVAEFDLDRPEIDGDTVRVERQLVGPEAAAREVLGDETDGWEFLPGTGHGTRVALTRTVPDGGSAERSARTSRASPTRSRLPRARGPRTLTTTSREPGCRRSSDGRSPSTAARSAPGSSTPCGRSSTSAASTP